MNISPGHNSPQMNAQLPIAKLAHTIRLTPAWPEGVETFVLATSQLIAYAAIDGVTRLWVTGRKVLEVVESTEEIDRLVRSAAA
jgi:hypothetical protein